MLWSPHRACLSNKHFVDIHANKANGDLLQQQHRQGAHLLHR